MHTLKLIHRVVITALLFFQTIFVAATGLDDNNNVIEADIVGNLKIYGKNKDDNKKYDILNNKKFGSSFVLVSINGKVARFGSAQGKNVKLTYQQNNRLISIWSFHDVEFKQVVSYIDDPFLKNKKIIRVAFLVENKSKNKKKVGIRVVLDTQNGDFDKQKITVPGYGFRDKGLVLKGKKIPGMIYCVTRPGKIKNSWVLYYQGKNLTAPEFIYFSPEDEVSVENKLMLSGNDLKDNFSGESAVSLLWDEKIFKPGQKDGIAFALGSAFFGYRSSEPVNASFAAPNTVTNKPFWVSVQLRNEDRLWDAKYVRMSLTVDNSSGLRCETARIIKWAELERGRQNSSSWRLMPVNPGKYLVQVRISFTFKSKKSTILFKKNIIIK